MWQTILGAGGAIGVPLAKELRNYTEHVRLVSRNPKKEDPDDGLVSADLTVREQADKAIEGSSVAYLVVGLEYKLNVWQQKWPLIMKNVIASCKKHSCKLVFFDNIYMYDKNYLSNTTEETPVLPCSKKGAVRAEIATRLLKEFDKGELTALIARAADFAGPKNSVVTETVYGNLAKGKKADWFIDVNKVHSFTFVNDAAKATAMLGNTAGAYNQVWHLPTSPEKLTGLQWIELFAKELDVKAKYRVLPMWMMGILGAFIPILKEFKEMAYQYDRDYFFNSSKFNSTFSFKPTSPQEIVRWIVQNVKS